MAQLSVDMPTLEGHTNSEPEEPHVVSCLLAAGKFTALAFHPLNLQCGTFSFSLSFCVRLSVYVNGFYLGSGNDIFIQINCLLMATFIVSTTLTGGAYTTLTLEQC